eukprot:scaffold6614_cov51-Attheya_sp.AAC.2
MSSPKVNRQLCDLLGFLSEDETNGGTDKDTEYVTRLERGIHPPPSYDEDPSTRIMCMDGFIDQAE